MSLAKMIWKLRTDSNMSQAKFAETFGVTPQAVQKWESGESSPSVDKIIAIAQRFGVSIDALLLDRNERLKEELSYNRKVKPKYASLHPWEAYWCNLSTEYRQCIEEGLDIEAYSELFNAVVILPNDENKKRLSDVIFDIVRGSNVRDGYPYMEPSDIELIKNLREPYPISKKELGYDTLKDKIHGAWMGRICGCMLGKTVEGINTSELHALLKKSGNYPMHRYILSSDLDEEIIKNTGFPLASRPYIDQLDGMPVDDDTNYVVLAQELISRYGRDFTPYDLSRIWLSLQSKDAYCTAERVAFVNFVKGYEPPESAIYKNPYREWIGAQIRGDYFGYINPGDPETAADMAFRDACVSHVKNGIYGEMLASAMIASAACCDSMTDVVRSAAAQIPSTSRLYERVMDIVSRYENSESAEAVFEYIHTLYDENNGHDWCHTISNAMIVVASLLYGDGDFGKSVCMAVQTGFDTDCNGATVGSVVGMMYGLSAIGKEWSEPMRDTLYTSVFGVGKVKISDRVEMTMKHIK